MDYASSTSISQVHYACVDAFVSLLNAAAALPLDQRAYSVRAIQNAFDKYKVWAGNLGAMHSGRQWKKSLDYRLRQASFYKIQVLRLLESLRNGVERGVALIDANSFDETDSDGRADAVPNDEDSPWEVSSDSEDDGITERQDHISTPSTGRTSDSTSVPTASNLDISAALHLINHILSCLWKLPIRNPAPLDRMKESSTADTSYYQPFDIQHVKNKFPMVDEKVALRLGKMISRRRQILRYRQSHMDSLGKTRNIPRRQVVDAKLDKEVVDVENIEAAPSYAASTHHTYSTHATTLRIDGNERPHATWNLDAPSVAMTVSSVGSDQDNNSPLAIPKRPKGEDGATLEQFICSYCHTVQTIRTDRSWRRHILLDLQPYVCTYAECALGEHTFQGQEEWYQHEALNHRYHWFCNVEGHDTFETADTFAEHMKSSHYQDFRKDELHALQHTFRRPASTQIGVCPLCFKTTQKIKSHVARHLKQLALFALPQTDFMALSDKNDESGSDKANRSDQAIHSPQRSDPASNDSIVSSSQNIRRQDSEATNLPEEDTDTLVFDDTQTFSFPGGTTQDTSWDYVTPKFRDARRQDRTDHQVEGMERNQTFSVPLPESYTAHLPDDLLQSLFPEAPTISAQEQENPISQAQFFSHETLTTSQAPELNLIQPTPPGSDANDMGTLSRPSSPTQDSTGANEGENQTHSVVPDSRAYAPTSETHVDIHESGTANNEPSAPNMKLDSGDREIDPNSDLQTKPSLVQNMTDRRSKQAAESTETVREGENRGSISKTTGDNGNQRVMNPYYQQRPICGASIGAFRGVHLPPVSLGGIILVDGEPYGLTVHHMLDDPSDDESEAEHEEQDSRDVPVVGQSSPTASPQAKQLLNTETSALPSTSDTYYINSTYLVSPNDPVASPRDLSSTAKPGSLPSQSPQPVEHHISNQFAEASSNSEASKLPRNSTAPDKARSDNATSIGLDILYGSNEDRLDDTPSDTFLPGESLSDSEYGEGSEQNLAYGSGLRFTGDVLGIAPGEGKDVVITQPAIDDVDEGFFASSPDPVDEDHLVHHRLGYIHASSGMRRVNRNGVLHEVDWALIKIDPDRLQMYNVVQGGRRFTVNPDSQDPPPLVDPVTRHYYPQEDDEYPMEVAPEHSLGGLNVHCYARTTGLQGGMIDKHMHEIRIYRRTSFSMSWFVNGNFGLGGDTGAWVIENGTGRVCGVVLAFAESSKGAYIMPMEIILEDIKRTLSAETVCLPGCRTISNATNKKE